MCMYTRNEIHRNARTAFPQFHIHFDEAHIESTHKQYKHQFDLANRYSILYIINKSLSFFVVVKERAAIAIGVRLYTEFEKREIRGKTQICRRTLLVYSIIPINTHSHSSHFHVQLCLPDQQTQKESGPFVPISCGKGCWCVHQWFAHDNSHRTVWLNVRWCDDVNDNTRWPND